MPDEVSYLSLQIDPEVDADAAELEDLTDQLRRELADLDVDSVERKLAAEAPEGAKVADGFVIGGLIVNGAVSGRSCYPSYPGVAATFLCESRGDVNWGRHHQATNASREDQERLIALLEERYGRS